MGSASSLLWAMHISDGALTWPWLLGGFVGAAVLITAALLADRLRAKLQGLEFRESDVAQIAVLTAAFYVASSIHIRLGYTSVHLLLNGLLGVVLGWRAALAIPVGLFLQFVLFHHGGWNTLGVNTCIMVLPALLAWALFAGLHRLPWLRSAWFRGVLVAFSVLLWELSLVWSVALALDADLLTRQYLPGTIVVVLIVAVLAAYLEPRLENAPEFPLGLLVGEIAVVGSSRVDLQACKLEYSIVSPK